MDSTIAIVTGGHCGIGLAISSALAKKGCTVVVGTRKPGEAAVIDRVADATGSKAVMLELDVGCSESVSRFHNAVTERFGHAHVLVNNAGVSVHQLTSEQSDESWQRVLNTNLSGPMRTIRAFLPAMKQQARGRIVNIASTAANTAVAESAAYCASKSGLLGLSRAVALEGAAFGVSCVTVSPTWVETDMLRASTKVMAQCDGTSYEQMFEQLRNSNPQKRLVQPEEIATLVAFLCCEAAPSLTMEDIQINAGAFW